MDKSTQETMFSSKSQEWGTPPEFYERLNWRFGPFTLDPCADEENAKCSTYFTESDDGLVQDWGGHTVFCNPPYNDMKSWARKCHEESLKPDTKVVLLCPARTDTRYFADYIMKSAEIHFIKGRLKFGNSTNCAPFPSMIVVFNGSHTGNIQDYAPKISLMRR
jgi:phage N-6-adenine-methyltransferase